MSLNTVEHQKMVSDLYFQIGMDGTGKSPVGAGILLRLSSFQDYDLVLLSLLYWLVSLRGWINKRIVTGAASVRR
jgi:hypothetical protein